MYISELIENRSKLTEISQDWVLLEIARVAFNDPRKAFDRNGNLLNVEDWPAEVAAAISSIKVTEVDISGDCGTTVKEIKFWDKGRQLELAAKHLGMLQEKEQSQPVMQPIVFTRVVEH